MNETIFNHWPPFYDDILQFADLAYKPCPIPIWSCFKQCGGRTDLTLYEQSHYRGSRKRTERVRFLVIWFCTFCWCRSWATNIHSINGMVKNRHVHNNCCLHFSRCFTHSFSHSRKRKRREDRAEKSISLYVCIILYEALPPFSSNLKGAFFIFLPLSLLDKHIPFSSLHNERLDGELSPALENLATSLVWKKWLLHHTIPMVHD